MRRVLMLALAATVQASALGSAFAQPNDDHTRALHLAARNALGVLEFCHDQGMIGSDAVAAQRQLVATLPPIADAAGDAEEAAGRQGYLAFDKRQAVFERSAMAQGISLAVACQVRAATALAATH